MLSNQRLHPTAARTEAQRLRVNRVVRPIQIETAEGETQMRMMVVLLMILSPAVGVTVVGVRAASSTQASTDHVAWVAQVLTRIETIKPGMTRQQLLTVFTTEGGLSTALSRTFVTRECPYFKVDVEFKAAGRPDRDAEGRVTGVEGDRDIIVRISKPYLQFAVMD